MEGDPIEAHEKSAAGEISIHALRVEGDPDTVTLLPAGTYFYPRPPGGGRQRALCGDDRRRHFYPRPPGGGRHVADTYAVQQLHFYPRPPGGGRHYDMLIEQANDQEFLSTPSGWRATRGVACFCDTVRNFYPRPPGGGRPGDLIRDNKRYKFLSTPSGWRATGSQGRRVRRAEFLSTPSGWRATTGTYSYTLAPTDFYPRPPGGGRLPCL